MSGEKNGRRETSSKETSHEAEGVVGQVDADKHLNSGKCKDGEEPTNPGSIYAILQNILCYSIP